MLATKKHACRWRKAATELEAKLADKDAALAALTARVNQIEHSLANVKDVREVTSGRTNHGPSLHRGDAEHCIAFFRALVRSTTDAAITQFNLA